MRVECKGEEVSIENVAILMNTTEVGALRKIFNNRSKGQFDIGNDTFYIVEDEIVTVKKKTYGKLEITNAILEDNTVNNTMARRFYIGDVEYSLAGLEKHLHISHTAICRALMNMASVTIDGVSIRIQRIRANINIRYKIFKEGILLHTNKLMPEVIEITGLSLKSIGVYIHKDQVIKGWKVERDKTNI